MPFIGCHISVETGIESAPSLARLLGCEAIQIFTSNQMQWKELPISLDSASNFLEEQNKNHIKIVVSHDSYLINLASPEPTKRAMSRKAFLEEIDRCDLLKIPFLVFHPGSHMGKGDEHALRAIAESLNLVFEKRPESRVTPLLETTAGQGSNVGYSFEQLKKIIDYSQFPERLGVCFDTCHAYAAGYDLVSEDKYMDTFQRFDDVIGMDRLKCFHLNDSKKALGSRVDRHANLGEGFIGWDVFYRLVNDERFAKLPMILETPGGDDNIAREISTLKASKSD